MSSQQDWFSLTARQSLVWADEQILAETRYHHWVLLVRVKAELDAAQLIRVWAETAAAHDAMSIIADTQLPRQRFGRDWPGMRQVTLPSGVSIEQWVAEQSCREFDRSRQPWEAVLVTSANHETAFMLRAHYLVCDEYSFGLIATELSERYQSRQVEAPGKYRDFLQREQLPQQLERAEQDRQSWQRLLQDPPPPAAPLGCSRASDGLATTRIVREVSADQVQALRRFGAASASISAPVGDTLNCAVTTVILAWLHRLSGQRDIVVAAPLNTRDAASARTVGLISEPILLRVEFGDAETFLTLHDKVASAYAFARQHAAASLGSEEAVTAFVGSMPEWPGNFCGQEAQFTIGNAPSWSKVGLGVGDRRDSLGVRFVGSGGANAILFEFNDKTYPANTRDRLIGYFFRFFEAFLADSTQCLRNVEWLTAEELRTLRIVGQGRQPPEAPDLVTEFARQVLSNPEKTAIEFENRALTYVEFDRVTNRLARRLRALGVDSESRVAVAMPRGFGEISALFATLKAGGAYVPVDPSHPVERVRVILEDAEPQVLVAPSDSPLRAALPPGVHWLELDDPLTEAPGFDAGSLEAVVVPDQLAYILFTSGSTGRPKGVEIPRQAFANFLQSMAAEPGLTSTDRVIAITTTTFDISGLELFLPLYVGATVVIADRDTASDPLRLRAMLERTQISLLQATPATWRLLLDAGWTGHPRLRMLCGGEAMSLALARRLLACGSELWNVYGPTETTVWSTLELIPRDVERITIGHPIDHTQIDLRDVDARLVPMGTIGEICIGGRGLARGYRGRPELTAERFPVDVLTGERFYKTGDLGRYLPDGRLECLGRVDHQIKVRGFRIEPADIEAQFRGVPGVNEVLVLARTSGEGDPQLVAYWVGSATRDALHQCAKERLPHYMVPSAYVHLELFPLSTSGKIDRKQLPAPELQQSEADAGLPPRNDQESIVAGIWREILGLSFVPVDRDFFSLGGTSIRAIQLRSKIQDSFGVNLPLRTLFEQPTVEAIVAQLGNPESDDAPITSWLARGSNPIPWIGVMGVQLFEDIARALPSDQSLLAIHVPVRYVPGVDAFPTVAQLASKYLRVIREHQPKGPYCLLGLCHGGVVAFEAAAQLEEAGEMVAVVGVLDAELPAARRTLLEVRLRHVARDLLLDPKASWRRALAAVARRVPTLGPLLGVGPDVKATRNSSEAVDMPFDGPEIDADLVAYEALARRCRCTIVAFRATGSDLSPWIVVNPDLGWSGRAAKVTCHDIAASHLGIMRSPHAAEVARLLTEARRAANP